jgi:hypothetical protein
MGGGVGLSIFTEFRIGNAQRYLFSLPEVFFFFLIFILDWNWLFSRFFKLFNFNIII